MAYQMIHLEVAMRLIPQLNISKESDYILGSVAPDSVHMDKDYRVEDKICSHLFEGCGPWGDTRDYERWLNNIRQFQNTYVSNIKDANKSSSPESSFALGIIVHTLTDYCNDLFLWRRFQKTAVPPMTLEEFRSDYYPEALGIDQYLFTHSKRRSDAFLLLSAGNAYTFGDLLKVENLERMRKHLLEEQYSRAFDYDISEYKYLSKDILEEFLKKTENFILDFFKKSCRQKG